MQPCLSVKTLRTFFFSSVLQILAAAAVAVFGKITLSCQCKAIDITVLMHNAITGQKSFEFSHTL